MKNWIIFVLILSNIIDFSLAYNYYTQINSIKIGVGDNELSNKKEELFFNYSKSNFLEENSNETKLIRKSNNFWILFLIIFLVAFLASFILFFICPMCS